jgi:hypothetical protein
MQRPGIEVLWGVLAGLIALLIARMLLLYLFPPPPGVNLADADQIRQLAGTLTFGVFAVLILSWVIAAAAASGVAVNMSGGAAENGWYAAAPVGLFVAWRGLALHYPVWVVLIGLILMGGAAFGVGRLMGRSPAR